MLHAHLIGEDYTEFTIELEATSEDEAYAEIDLLYPEAAISEIFDPIERSNAIYARAQRMYDNDEPDRPRLLWSYDLY